MRDARLPRVGHDDAVSRDRSRGRAPCRSPSSRRPGTGAGACRRRRRPARGGCRCRPRRCGPTESAARPTGSMNWPGSEPAPPQRAVTAPGGGVEAHDPLVAGVRDVERTARERRASAARRRSFPDRSRRPPTGRRARSARCGGSRCPRRRPRRPARPRRRRARSPGRRPGPWCRARAAARRSRRGPDDAAVLRVGHVDVAAAVGGHAARLGELAAARNRSGRRRAGVGSSVASDGIVARGRVLDLQLQGLEQSRAAEVLAHVQGRVLRSDRAPDLVEEPPAQAVPEARARDAALLGRFREPPRADRDPFGVVLGRRAASRARPPGPSRRR